MTPNIQTKLKQARRLLKSGESGKAIALYQKLLKRIPEDSDLHYGIGRAYKAAGQLNNALPHFNQAIKLGERGADLFAENAELLTLLNRPEEAETMARAAVALDPGSLLALRLLARILLPLGKFSEAKFYAEQLVERSPNNASDIVRLGWANLTLEHYDRAIVLANQAIAIDAKSGESCYLLSCVYKQVQQWAKALEMVERAIALEPASAEYIAMRANMLEYLGRFEDAYDVITPLTDQPRPRNGLAVLVFARLAKRFGQQARAVLLLEDLVSDSAKAVTMQCAALSLLGGLYEAQGDNDKAFAAIDSGNKIRPSQYSEENTEKYMQKICAWFTGERVQNPVTARAESNKPIFIVGMPRSGTSLTEQILSRHPDIEACGETVLLPKLLHQQLPELLACKTAFPECMEKLTSEVADQAVALYLQEIGVAEGMRITEKRPMNFMYLGAIAQIFPGAKIIHCTRDPLDIGLSCYFANFTSTSELGFSQDLELFATYYKLYEQMMSHWREVLPLQIFEMSYEALASDPQSEVPKLLDFCELSWNDDCMNPHESTQLTTTASYDQVRRPINARSVGRWKQYERQLEPLRVSLGLSASKAA